MTDAQRQFRHRVKTGVILSPETKPVYLGYKEPLTPIKDGFGFYGTLAYDESKEFTQCFICGYYFKKLGTHVKREHDKPVKNYKLEYGLAANTSLIAPVYRQTYNRQWESMTDEQRIAKVAQMVAQRKHSLTELSRKGNKARRDNGVSLHKKNLEGRCPEQLLQKILDLKDKLERQPTQKEFIKNYGWGMSDHIRNTFGSWTEALKIIGLQPLPVGKFIVYDQAILIRMLIDFKKINGREPYTKDLIDGSLPTWATFNRHFGSFTRAKQAAQI